MRKQPRTQQCGALDIVRNRAGPASGLLSGGHIEAVGDIACDMFAASLRYPQGPRRKYRKFQEFNEQPSPGACVVL